MTHTPTLRHWSDIAEGERLRPLAFPLSIYRLVVAAGANRDFNAIHHNSEFARASGAPDMYANSLFLQGMWERAVRDHIGPAGQIHQLRGFRMKSFNCVGDTVTVHGQVQRTWCGTAPADLPDTATLPTLDGRGWLQIQLWSENRDGISVGPGHMVVSLPLRAPA